MHRMVINMGNIIIDNTNKEFIRDSVGQHMSVIGEMDSKVLVVNADLMKTCRNTSFVEKYPERSFNVGIAEQNLVSFAAGLAHEGFKPYVFSMAPFLSMRACEQCRTDVAYANLDMRIVGAYSGVSGGISGATHWGMEDCSIFVSMPNMSVIEFSDANQAKAILESTLDFEGPVYFRVTVEPTYRIYSEEEKFEVGRSKELKEGSDGVFLCSGVLVAKAIEAARLLEEERGLSIGVTDMYSIKPIDEEAILKAAKTGHVVAAQDHLIHGGLCSVIANTLAQRGLGIRYKALGIEDKFNTMAHAPALYEKFGLDVNGLKEAMIELFD